MDYSRRQNVISIFVLLIFTKKVSSFITCDLKIYFNDQNYTELKCSELPDSCGYDDETREYIKCDKERSTKIDTCSVHHIESGGNVDWKRNYNFLNFDKNGVQMKPDIINDSIIVARTYEPTKKDCRIVLNLKKGGT